MGNLTFDFSGRVVIVTGAAQGIGRELGRRFAADGATTYLVDLDKELLEEAADRTGGRPLVADVSSTADVEHVIETVTAESGRLDIVVNNAGILRDRVVWKLTDDDWNAVIAVHAGGAFRFTRAAVPLFRAQLYGRVINVTSYTGLHGNTGQANYATAKAGIVGLTKTTAKELAAFGVTVNAVSPNAETRMVASIPDAKKEEITAGIPLRRFADPSEMYAAVAFLSSEEAGYITGTVLQVDGGLSM